MWGSTTQVVVLHSKNKKGKKMKKIMYSLIALVFLVCSVPIQAIPPTTSLPMRSLYSSVLTGGLVQDDSMDTLGFSVRTKALGIPSIYSVYKEVPACRLVDTRLVSGFEAPWGNSTGNEQDVQPNERRTYPAVGFVLPTTRLTVPNTCWNVIPSDVVGLMLNVTAIPNVNNTVHGAFSFPELYYPTVFDPVFNFQVAGSYLIGTVSSKETVTLDSGGSFTLINWAANADYLIDVLGYYYIDNGAQGPQGDTGPIGPAGPTGLTGAQGLQGIQGIQGPIGPQGLTGTNGTTCVVVPANAVNPTAWNMLCSIPPAPPVLVASWHNGAPGATGEAGPAGPAGPTGLTGAQGLPGPAGLQGPIGPEGPAGSCSCPWVCHVCNVAGIISGGLDAFATVGPGGGIPTENWTQCATSLPTTQPFTVYYIKDGNPKSASYARGTYSLSVDKGSTYCVLTLPSSQ